MAADNDAGKSTAAVRIECQDTAAIVEAVKALQPFRAVIEAAGTYRWLYDLLRPHGAVLLANLLRINQIPLACIPPRRFQQLRELTRLRARLGRERAAALRCRPRDLVAAGEG